MYTEWARDLKQNTTVMQETFSRFNLQVLQFTFNPIEDEEGCEVIIEVSSTNGAAMPDDADIKINMYDGNGNIMLTDEKRVWSQKFAGYDTFKICMFENEGPLFESRQARIFMV